jgi:hypothetical protein
MSGRTPARQGCGDRLSGGRNCRFKGPEVGTPWAGSRSRVSYCDWGRGHRRGEGRLDGAVRIVRIG